MLNIFSGGIEAISGSVKLHVLKSTSNGLLSVAGAPMF